MRKAIGIVIICCIFALSGCSRDMNYIIANEPSLTGVVTEVYANSFLMLGEGTEVYDVSLNVERKDSYTSVAVGDEVIVYYNGDIAESEPPRIDTVYAIVLRTPAENN